jgi:methionyl-tRNA formyltransferase
VPIAADDTALTLYGKLTEAAGTMFAEALPLLAAGTAPRMPLDLSQGSYYGGRRPADGMFAWDWPARRIHNLVRAVTHPYPGAFVPWRGGELLVWRARPVAGAAGDAPGTLLQLTGEGPLVATGDGQLLLLSVQSPGQPELPGTAFAETHGLTPGDHLA